MFHLFKYRIKVLSKQKMMLFWTLIFPIALATFFNLAFSNLASSESFNVVDVAVINDSGYENNIGFKSMIESLSKEDQNQLFNTKYLTLTEAKEKLENNEIAGYFIVTDNIEMVIKKNGIDQTIMKLTVDRYKQISNMTTTLLELSPEALKNGILNELDNDTNYINEINSNNTDVTVIYFYTLIGMVCMYAGFFGISAVNESEANLSKRGARINISPTHKFKSLIVSSLAGWLFQFIELLILLAYLIFVLKIDFGTQIPYLILLIAVGSFTGLTLGTFFSGLIKKDEDFKISTFVTVSLVLSFLSGMMVVQMKYWILTYAPILAKINPVSIITDALYSLYYYTTYSRYWMNIGSLCIFSFVMILLSYLVLRRKRYDSI